MIFVEKNRQSHRDRNVHRGVGRGVNFCVQIVLHTSGAFAKEERAVREFSVLIHAYKGESLCWRIGLARQPVQTEVDIFDSQPLFV